VDWEGLLARFWVVVLLEVMAAVVDIRVEVLEALWALLREAYLVVGRSRIVLSSLEIILVRNNRSSIRAVRLV
jgi:hypothetical protein